MRGGWSGTWASLPRHGSGVKLSAPIKVWSLVVTARLYPRVIGQGVAWALPAQGALNGSHTQPPADWDAVGAGQQNSAGVWVVQVGVQS